MARGDAGGDDRNAGWIDGGADRVWAGATLAGADGPRAYGFGDDVCDLRLVDNGWSADSDCCSAFWCRSRCPLSAVDYNACRCDGVGYLLFNREGNPRCLATGKRGLNPDFVLRLSALLHSSKRERHGFCALTAVNTRREPIVSLPVDNPFRKIMLWVFEYGFA